MLDTRAVFVVFVGEVAVRQVLLSNAMVFPCHYFTNAQYSYFIYLISTLYVLINDGVSKQNALLLKMKPWTLNFVN